MLFVGQTIIFTCCVSDMLPVTMVQQAIILTMVHMAEPVANPTPMQPVIMVVTCTWAHPGAPDLPQLWVVRCNTLLTPTEDIMPPSHTRAICLMETSSFRVHMAPLPNPLQPLIADWRLMFNSNVLPQCWWLDWEDKLRYYDWEHCNQQCIQCINCLEVVIIATYIYDNICMLI
jgi:hypothetical protein